MDMLLGRDSAKGGPIDPLGKFDAVLRVMNEGISRGPKQAKEVNVFNHPFSQLIKHLERVLEC